MNIAVSGSSGFIGTHLDSFLKEKGFRMVPLKRSYFTAPDTLTLEEALKDCDVVINLAGATINHRWTEAYKKEIMDSRVNTTRKLTEAINRMKDKPSVLVSVSAVGIYLSEGVYTEKQAVYGTDFLAEVCKNWEQEARQVSPDVRLIIPRFGVVLASDGGALPQMLLPFRLFAGGRVGNGRQGFSWIHIDDLLNAIYFLIEHPMLSGVFNFTAPQILTNSDFAEIAAKELHRPDWIPVPAFVFDILYGEGSSFITGGQQAYPERLLKNGFVFKYGELHDALRNLLSKNNKAEPQLSER